MDRDIGRQIDIDVEVAVRTPGGLKPRRFIDVAATDAMTGETIEGVVVGVANAHGEPVTWRRRQLEDIRGALPHAIIAFKAQVS